MLRPPSPTDAKQTAKATAQHKEEVIVTQLSPSVGRLACKKKKITKGREQSQQSIGQWVEHIHRLSGNIEWWVGAREIVTFGENGENTMFCLLFRSLLARRARLSRTRVELELDATSGNRLR